MYFSSATIESSSAPISAATTRGSLVDSTVVSSDCSSPTRWRCRLRLDHRRVVDLAALLQQFELTAGAERFDLVDREQKAQADGVEPAVGQFLGLAEDVFRNGDLAEVVQHAA